MKEAVPKSYWEIIKPVNLWRYSVSIGIFTLQHKLRP